MKNKSNRNGLTVTTHAGPTDRIRLTRLFARAEFDLWPAAGPRPEPLCRAQQRACGPKQGC